MTKTQRIVDRVSNAETGFERLLSWVALSFMVYFLAVDETFWIGALWVAAGFAVARNMKP